MTTTLIIGLATIGAIYTAFINDQNRSSRQRFRQRMYHRMQPEIQFDYNRFNTKGERNSHWEIDGDRIYLETDIQTL